MGKNHKYFFYKTSKRKHIIQMNNVHQAVFKLYLTLWSPESGRPARQLVNEYRGYQLSRPVEFCSSDKSKVKDGGSPLGDFTYHTSEKATRDLKQKKYRDLKKCRRGKGGICIVSVVGVHGKKSGDRLILSNFTQKYSMLCFSSEQLKYMWT